MSKSSLVLCVWCFALNVGGIFGQSLSAHATSHSLTIWKDDDWATIEGQVRSISGSALVFEQAGAFGVKSIPFSLIRKFTFTSDPDFARGTSSFGTKNFEPAQRHFEKALESEGRAWAKPEILVRIAESMIADNRRHDAIGVFEQISRLAPDSRLLGRLPLVWDERLPETERLKLPVDQLTTGSDVRRLAIASSVLHNPRHQRRAISVLKKLKVVSDSSAISHLATAQLWRLGLLDTTETVQMLTDVWEKQWRRMPGSVRSGPGYVLGRCLQRQNEFNRAALVLLWSPYVQFHDRSLAAAGLRSAADCLTAAGRKSEAESVYRELLLKFSDQSSSK